MRIFLHLNFQSKERPGIEFVSYVISNSDYHI